MQKCDVPRELDITITLSLYFFLTQKGFTGSPSPHLLRIIAQPILNGVLGKPLLVKEIPMIIIHSEEKVIKTGY